MVHQLTISFSLCLLLYFTEDRKNFIVRSQTDGEFLFVSEDDKHTWVQMINMAIKQLNSTPVELTALKGFNQSKILSKSVLFISAQYDIPFVFFIDENNEEEEQGRDAETEKLKQQIVNDITKDELIDTIIAWSEMKTEDVINEIKILAEKLQNWRRLHNTLKK
jgi:hypothetical protein